MVKALFNAVIVKKIEQDESTYGTIVVPDMGNFIETVVKVGDEVLLPSMGATKMDYKGEEYLMIEENKILGIVEK